MRGHRQNSLENDRLDININIENQLFAGIHNSGTLYTYEKERDFYGRKGTDSKDSSQIVDEHGIKSCKLGTSSSARRMSASEHFPPISDTRLTCITPTGSYTKTNPINQLTVETIKQRNRSESSVPGSNDRSYKSRESNSSSSQSCNALGYISSRSKSLGTNDRENSANSKNSAKLETLFETKNGMSTTRLQKMTSHGYKRLNSQSTVSSKPPIKKVLGHSASDGQLIPVERTSIRDHFANNLHRNNSDQRLNMIVGKQTKNSKTRGRSVSVERAETGKNKSSQFGGMRRTSSSLVINSSQYGGTVRDDSSYRTSDDDFRETGSFKDKDKRILDWLLGVQDEADVPPDPVIEYAEEPPQTDTAVHIIYGEK